MTIAENWHSVQETLRKAGRGGEAVQVVGVTKFQPQTSLEAALDVGLRHLGNNYAQEGEAFRQALSRRDVEWHFVGHIQSRKVKFLTAYDWVQSLDRESIASDLNARLEGSGRRVSCLIEVNVGGEAQKSGVEAEALEALLQKVALLPNLKLRGLMSMPPPLEPVELRRPFFRRMHELFERYRSEYAFDCLSMGTSADYLVAVQEGATMIRLGTTLFGERHYPTKP